MSRAEHEIKEIRTKSRRGFSLLLTVGVLFSFLGVTIAAWFASVNTTQFGFTTGGLESGIEIKIATVDTYDSAGAKQITQEENRKYSDIVSSSMLRDDSALLEADIQNYTFGLIDNLLVMHPDNIAYLQVRIPKSTNANTLKFALHYNEKAYNNFDAYKNNTVDYTELHARLFDKSISGEKKWDDVTDETGEDAKLHVTDFINIERDEKKGLCYLQFSYCLSSLNLEANAIASANLQFGQLYNFNDFTAKELTIADSNKNENGDCYLYIKITPNFKAIGLSGIMNSLAYFKIQAEFEAYNKSETTQAVTTGGN